MHLTRYHGVFAPRSRLRAVVTPAGRGAGAGTPPMAERCSPPMPRHVAMSWARRLKRVFGVEIERCARCNGKLAIIAKILSHLGRTASERYPAAASGELPVGARAPSWEPSRR